MSEIKFNKTISGQIGDKDTLQTALHRNKEGTLMVAEGEGLIKLIYPESLQQST